MTNKIKGTTRSDVLRAIAECDELGRDVWLAKHGYQPSKLYAVELGGRRYDSKAVIGVASGLRASEFSGGAEHTVKVLVGLGFVVLKGGEPVTVEQTKRKRS
jgi:5-methylcytosine-specific restriction protein A